MSGFPSLLDLHDGMLQVPDSMRALLQHGKLRADAADVDGQTPLELLETLIADTKVEEIRSLLDEVHIPQMDR